MGFFDFFARLCAGAADELSDSAHWIVPKHDHSIHNGWVDQDERGRWYAIGATDDRARVFTSSADTKEQAFAAWYQQYQEYHGMAPVDHHQRYLDWRQAHGFDSSPGPSLRDIYGDYADEVAEIRGRS